MALVQYNEYLVCTVEADTLLLYRQGISSYIVNMHLCISIFPAVYGLTKNIEKGYNGLVALITANSTWYYIYIYIFIDSR